jgi:hypothetical protein
MTDLARKVTRRTREAYPVLFHKPERIVVSLEAGDLLTFRAAGRRHVWTLPIVSAWRYAIRMQALADAEQQRQDRKAGRRVRRSALFAR